MNENELRKKICISSECLREYKQIKKNSGDEYSEEEIHELSLMLTLKEIGFSTAEIRHYMNLPKGKDGDLERNSALDKKREKLLSCIHSDEEKLEILDCLRYKQK